jgi:hypothetical protein
MARKSSKINQEFILSVNEFQNGLNTNLNPIFLSGQVPDCNNIMFDDPVGIVRKVYGYEVKNSFPFSGFIIANAIEYTKSTGEKFIVISAFDISTKKYKVFYYTDALGYVYIPQATSEFMHNFAVLDDILWITNGFMIPVVFNGLEVKVLDGNGVDWDNNAIANFSLPFGLTPGKYICVHQNRIVMANTIESGSEIIFSRFVDDEGNLIKATSSKAWVNINQILVNPEDGEDITAIYPYLGMLVVFKESSMYIINGELTNPAVIKLPTNKGCIDSRTIDIWQGILVFLAKDGVYGFDGREVKWLSKDIDTFFINLALNKTKINSIKVSTTQEFNSLKLDIFNFRTVGTSENSLQVPANFVVSDGDDFQNIGSGENIEFKPEGITIAKVNSIFTYEPIEIYKNQVGDLSLVFDKNLNTYLEVSDKQSKYSTSGVSSNVKIQFKLKTTTDTYISKLSFKVDFDAEVSVTGLKKEEWMNRSFTKVLSVVLVDGSNKTLLGYFVDKNEGLYSGVINIDINRSFNTNQELIITLMCYSYIGATILGVVNSYASIKLYEVSINYNDTYYESATYYTQWIDTEMLENRGVSLFEFYGNIPSGTSANFYYAVSDTNDIPTTDNSITWISIAPPANPNLNKRYYAFKIVLNASSDRLIAPTINSIIQRFSGSSYYLGKKVLPQTPTKWRNFFCSYNLNNGNYVRFYISPDGVSYTEVQNGNDISTIMGSSNTIFFRIEAQRAGDANTPQIFAVAITYQIGDITYEVDLLNGMEIDNRYFLTLSDKCLFLNKTGVWSKINLTPVFVKESDNLCFITNKLCEFFKKGVFNTTCDFTTKKIILGTPLESFIIRKIWLLLDNNLEIGDNLSFSLTIGSSKNDNLFTKNLTFSKSTNLTNPVEINCGIKCYDFFAKISTNDINNDFRVVGLQFLIKPLRILSKEE